MSVHVWLRAETKPLERRTALTPESAEVLVEAGFEITVERSAQNCFPVERYAAAGCTLVDAGTWPAAPREAFILGLKELPESSDPLEHRHIYFAHVYKEQAGWQEVLRRFTQGGGQLLDLEFLVDDAGRRVAAYGYWAGFAGAAVAVKTWCGQAVGRTPVVPPLGAYGDRDELVAELNAELREASRAAGRAPTVIVIGALGRSGSGAVDLVTALDLEVSRWDLEETRAGGPFDAVVDHDIFVNCVLVFSPIPPFVTAETLARPGRTLRVISDVSCDPFSDVNPVPVYDELTSFQSPAHRLIDGDPPLDLVAIDHLPSMLPMESSEDFSAQLLPALLTLGDSDSGVWRRALEIFDDKIREL